MAVWLGETRVWLPVESMACTIYIMQIHALLHNVAFLQRGVGDQ